MVSYYKNWILSKGISEFKLEVHFESQTIGALGF